jgi:hypothetical protein
MTQLWPSGFGRTQVIKVVYANLSCANYVYSRHLYRICVGDSLAIVTWEIVNRLNYRHYCAVTLKTRLGLFGHLIILFVAAADASGRHEFPPSLSLPLSLKSPLRYGENPHQRAAFYEDKSLSEVGTGGIATAVQHHGKVYDLLLVASDV